jgi:hypothetical protein
MSEMPNRSRELRAFARLRLSCWLSVLSSTTLTAAISRLLPLLKDELRLSVTQLSVLLSAFFWTYTAMQFVSG